MLNLGCRIIIAAQDSLLDLRYCFVSKPKRLKDRSEAKYCTFTCP